MTSHLCLQNTRGHVAQKIIHFISDHENGCPPLQAAVAEKNKYGGYVNNAIYSLPFAFSHGGVELSVFRFDRKEILDIDEL